MLAAAVGWFLANRPGQQLSTAAGEPEHLTACSRRLNPAATTIRAGEEVRTEAGQRRRFVLPDNSVLYVDQNSTLKLAAESELSLMRGRVFVEMGPRQKDASFVVKTSKRTVSGSAAHFAVQTGADGAQVIVTRGRAEVSGLDQPVLAGQQLAAGIDKRYHGSSRLAPA